MKRSVSGDRMAVTRSPITPIVVALIGLALASNTSCRRPGRLTGAEAAGVITTVAGNGISSYSGDGGPAERASLGRPFDVALGPDGALYIADPDNNCIRKVDPKGIITTVAGDGTCGYSGDGGPATHARLNNPLGVAVGPDGSLYIADESNHRIRRVRRDGIIVTIAGNGRKGYSGDGGRATKASLNTPSDVAVGPDSSFYIADLNNQRIRKVDPRGIITTVAGDGWSNKKGEGRYSGDGGPATEASLNSPISVAVGTDGTVYVADRDNQRIRKVDPAGTISTVAGRGGPPGYSGDEGPAIDASLCYPAGVAVGRDGDLYIVDRLNNRIRKLDPASIISTVAGGGKPPDGLGDGGPATEASLRSPAGLAVSSDGSLYIADCSNHRIRKVCGKQPD